MLPSLSQLHLHDTSNVNAPLPDDVERRIAQMAPLETIAEYKVSIARSVKFRVGEGTVGNLRYQLRIQKPHIIHTDETKQILYAKSIYANRSQIIYLVYPQTIDAIEMTLQSIKAQLSNMFGQRWFVDFRGVWNQSPFLEIDVGAWSYGQILEEWIVPGLEGRRVLDLEDVVVLKHVLNAFEPAFIQMLKLAPTDDTFIPVQKLWRRSGPNATFVENDQLVLSKTMTRRDVVAPELESYNDAKRVLDTTLIHQR